MKNNKGFSLVELIIVIAIMAILVGVMAPQLIKYIEKTNVSSDTQLCDSVKTAVTTAMMDPEVINATNSGIPSGNTWQTGSGSGAFSSAFLEIMGKNSMADINAGIKSWNSNGNAKAIEYNIVNNNSVHVRIPGSDSSGKKGAVSGYTPIYVD